MVIGKHKDYVVLRWLKPFAYPPIVAQRNREVVIEFRSQAVFSHVALIVILFHPALVYLRSYNSIVSVGLELTILSKLINFHYHSLLIERNFENTLQKHLEQPVIVN